MPPVSQAGTEVSGADASTVILTDGFSQVLAPDTQTNTDTDTGAPSATSPIADSEPKSLLDAIRLVVEPASQADGTVAKTTEEVAAEAADQTKAPDAGTTKDDADKPPPFHEHPRWKQVVGERDGFKARIGALEPDAQSFADVRTFMGRNGLTPDDVKQGFAIMAAMKNDPGKAWELLQTPMTQLRTFLGHDLPADLRQKVDDGLVDEATATETARLRNVATFTQNRAAATEQTQVQTRAVEDAQAIGHQVDAYIASVQGSDPDFKRFEPLLTGMVLQLQGEWSRSGRVFNTPQAAIALTQAAIAQAKAHLIGTRAPRQEIKAVPSGSTKAIASAAPISLRDAIAQAAAGTYRG